MNRGAWRATVHRVAKSQTWLSNYHSSLICLTLFLQLAAASMIKHQGKMYPFFWKLGLPSSGVSLFSHSLPVFLMLFTSRIYLRKTGDGVQSVWERHLSCNTINGTIEVCLVSLHVLALGEASIFLPPLGFMVVWVTKTLVELVEVGEWISGVKNLCPFWTESRLPPPPPEDCSQRVIWLMWKEVSVDFFWAGWGQSSPQSIQTAH